MATVLVVDDRATSREIARATLDRAGHQVVEALDGAQALQLARDSRPDVVVADVLMPGMDGYEFVHQLRADPDTVGIPVLFYTANYRENEARAIADACGVRRVVLKTADPEVLVRTVEELITEPAMSRPAPSGEAGAWEHLRTVNAKLVEKVLALDESDERFRGMADSAPIGILLGGPAGQATYVNPQLIEILGRPMDDLLGTGWVCCVDPQHREDVLAAARDDARVGEQRRFRDQVDHPDGTTRWLSTVVRPLFDGEGRYTGFVGMVDDVTAVVEAEEHRRAEDQERGREAERRAAERFESLSRLAGGVAHDFNNILNIILAYAEFATDAVRQAVESGMHGFDAPAVLADLTQIKRAGDRAAHLTHQLLAFGSREIVEPIVLDLNALVGEVRETVSGTTGKEIAVEISCDPDLGRVLADRNQLRQVLLNVAANASDAMAGTGTLRFETANASFMPEIGGPTHRLPPGDYVRVTVSDTGHGMTPEIVDRAIEPFFTTKSHGQGSGLGLATAYGILNQAGGDLLIESTVGAGTAVHMYLPTTDQPIQSNWPTSAEPTRGGETVLVAEDEDAVRDLVERVLTRAGYTVLTGVNGAAALAVAQSHEGPIHAVLTDVMMPEMEGPELAARLDTVRPGTPVLFMSGHAAALMTAEGVVPPGTLVLSKPFNRTELLDAVRQTIDRSRDNAAGT